MLGPFSSQRKANWILQSYKQRTWDSNKTQHCTIVKSNWWVPFTWPLFMSQKEKQTHHDFFLFLANRKKKKNPAAINDKCKAGFPNRTAKKSVMWGKQIFLEKCRDGLWFWVVEQTAQTLGFNIWKLLTWNIIFFFYCSNWRFSICSCKKRTDLWEALE